MRVNHVWLIPKTATKPEDGRFKKKMPYGAEGKYLGVFLRQDKNSVYIDVVDKGKGIEQEFISNVFDRLYTMEDSRNREYAASMFPTTILIVSEDGTLLGSSRLFFKPFFFLLCKICYFFPFIAVCKKSKDTY